MLLAYARVSTKDQSRSDRVSLAEQLARCKTIASLRGSTGKHDFKTFTDAGISGSVPLSDRPAGRELLEAADKGDIICASKLDRIFRSAHDALTTIASLNRKGIDLIICDIGIDPIGESPASKMFFGMLSLVAEFERERIHERITEGKLAKKQKGGHIGGSVPFGMRKVGHGKIAMLEPCPREQAHILRARALYDAAPTTSKQIALTMAEEGMVGRNGEPYGPQAIYRLIEKNRRSEQGW